MKVLRKILFICILILSGTSTYSQLNIINFSFQKRTSDILKTNAVTYPFGISKFIQNLNINNNDDWKSGSAVIAINGVPYNTLPLNYTSPDLVPVDLLQLKNVDVNAENDIRGYSSFPSGGINLNTIEISDSFLVSLRVFTGSETGDPLIYRFTRSEIPIVNKNKIVPSAVLSVEGKNNIKYRLAAGYFGYFAFNSSENSRILSGLGHELTKRQNRQIFGSGEIEYVLTKKRKLSLFSSFIHFYGWELPPFITSFVHLRSLSYANRLTISSLFKRFDAGIKFDGNVSRLAELDLMHSGKFGLNDISIFFNWGNTLTNRIEFAFYGEGGRYSGFNLNPGTRDQQNIFDRSHAYIYYNLSPQLEFTLSEHFKIISANRFEKNIISEHVYSGSLRFVYDPDPEQRLSFLFSFVAGFPGIFERYGKFYTFRSSFETNRLDTFLVSGNSNISYERVNSISVLYEFKRKNLEITLNPFLRKVSDQIIMYDSMVIPSFYPGDIIRNSVFLNSGENSSVGISEAAKFKFSFMSVVMNHSGIFRRNFNPINIILISSVVSAGGSGKIVLEYFYSSQRLYKDFELKNNLNRTDLFSARIPEIHFFTVAYLYNIAGLYYFKDIDLGIRIENILNRKIKFHPLGNTFDRTIEFFIAMKM